MTTGAQWSEVQVSIDLEGGALKEEAHLSFHPLLLTWICLPFLTIAIMMLNHFTSLAAAILFLPCFLGKPPRCRFSVS